MWDFVLHFDRTSADTLFMQIAAAIARDIRRGRLKPGDRLPGTRTLADKLGVNRVTVAAAYDELAAEGWVVTHIARGTFVAAEPPAPEALTLSGVRDSSPRIDEPAYAVRASPPPTRWLPPSRGLLAFRSNYPDTRLLRVDALLRAYRSGIRRSDGRLLGYAEPEGHPKLRRAIARMLCGTRGLAVSADHVLVTRGSQMGIALLAQTLVRPGDVVAVEDPGYRHAWAAFQHAGATLAAVPVDEAGVDVASVCRLAEGGRLRAVYLTPYHQLPTTVTLSQARRRALLRAAHAYQFVIIEDDYDYEFHFDGDPVAPLASLDPAVVAYVGTFSKILAPSLRMGFVVAPTSVVRELAAHRQALDMQGDSAMEAAIAELIENDEIPRHVRRSKRIYQRRRDVLVAALDKQLGTAVSFAVPAGGLGLWAAVSGDIDVDRWAAVSQQHGAAFLTGRAFSLAGESRPSARFGYGSLDENELQQGVARITAALHESTGRTHRA